MKSRFSGISIPPGTPLPTDEFFHSDSFAGGYDARDAQEDTAPGSSPSMLDMEATRNDRLIRAPGVTLSEAFPYQPTQVLVQAGFKYNSELLFVAAPYLGVKRDGDTQWYNVGLRTDVPYGFTNFAGVLLFSNGVKGTYYREPLKTTIAQIPGAPPAFGLTVFAGRVVLGGTLVASEMDFMGLGWSDATNDYKGWDYSNGAGYQSMIGSMRQADRFQAFAPLGFDTLAIFNRRSIWIGVPTGDTFQPIRFAPRNEETGCIAPRTVIPTMYGVLFLSDDGVCLFDGNSVINVSDQINADLLPITEGEQYSASFDPTRKRYYLHTPDATWVLDLPRKRWFRWSGLFTDSAFFPVQAPQGPTWGQLVGTWGEQAGAWWQYLSTESAGKMMFLRDNLLGFEDPTAFGFFGDSLTPEWFDRRLIGENQDQLMTGLGARFTYEAEDTSTVQIWLPDKPHGNFELVASAVLPGGPGTRRAWVPFIHTGRAISLGIKIVSGSPAIRKASVEFQRTGMLFDLEYTIEPPPPIEFIPTSDAILKPALVFMDHFSAGIAQSLGGGSVSYPQTGGRYANSNEGSGESGVEYSLTGGRDGGGCVTAIGAAKKLSVNPPVDNVIHASIISSHNLKGRVITEPETLQVFEPHLFIQVMPDYTLRAVWHEAEGFTDEYHEIGTPTEYTVPEDGEFVLETQAGLSPQFYNKGGFVTSNVYTDDGPTVGLPIIRAIGVRTRGLFGNEVDTFAQFSVVIPEDTSLSGWGIAYPLGAKKRFFYDTFFAPAMPVANGSVIQSAVEYSHHEFFGNLGGEPLLVGMDMTWGDPLRWKNLLSLTHSANNADEIMNFLQGLGELSGFTGDWLSGPNYPANPDPIVRNQFNGDARDLYRVAIDRSNVAVIEAVAPMALVGVRTIGGNYSSFPAAGGVLPWFFSGPRPLEDGVNPPWPQGDAHHAFNVGIKSPGGLITLTRSGKAIPVDSHSEWRALPGFTISPPSALSVDPETDQPFEPNALPEVLFEGSYAELDAIEPAISEDERFNLVDAAQVGLDVAFHKEAVVVAEPGPRAPIADLIEGNFSNIPGGQITVQDVSVDFNDGPDALLTGIVSRVVDWGDDSPTEEIETGSAGQLGHTYEVYGTYTVTLTVTNTYGLTATATLEFTFDPQLPTAAFEAEADPDDETGMTINFTDTSAAVLDPIASRLWDFGDGNTSTATNPSHTYSAPGTYTVTLTVTTGTGAIDDAEADLDLPMLDIQTVDDGLGDVPYLQGDALNGDNPPLTNYLTTEAFDQFFYLLTYRSFYNDSFDSIGDGISHLLTTKDGYKAIEMVFGGGYLGAGFNSSLSDDADPEVFYTVAPFGPTAQWARTVWQAEAGVMSDGSISDITTGTNRPGANTGLRIMGMSGRNWSANIYNRGGHLMLDVSHKTAAGGGFSNETFDLGVDTLYTGGTGFGDLIMRYDGDNVAHTIQLRVWSAALGAIAGTSPVLDETLVGQIGTSGGALTHELSVEDIDRFIRDFTPGGTQKRLWWTYCKQVPVSAIANPWGVALT